MRLHVADHPLITHKLTQLRDRDTDSFTFRHLVDELVMLLAYESTRQLPLVPKDIVTPVAATTGAQLATPGPLLVPILRAGLGMLNGMTQILPTAEVGFLGLVRNEETLMPSIYASRLPDDLTGRHVFLLDPMLATGGTLAAAMQVVHDRNAAEVTAVCLIAAPEGTTAVEAAANSLDLPITVVVGGMDERLNEVGYIVPGLGDAGDRLYGVV